MRVRDIPYSPMHKPRKPVSESDMHETLAKHAKPGQAGAAAPTNPNSPGDSTPAAPALEWLAPRKELGGVYVLESTCKRFAVHAQKQGSEWIYEALIQTPTWNNVLTLAKSKAEAIAACEVEAKKR